MKANNLRKVYKQMTGYCDDVLHVPLMPEDKPNLNSIGSFKKYLLAVMNYIF